MRREVLSLMFEFVISLVVLIGGGLLMYLDPSATFVQGVATAAITAVITFWFTRRMTEKATNATASAAQSTAQAAVSAPAVDMSQLAQQLAPTLLPILINAMAEPAKAAQPAPAQGQNA